MAENAMPLNVPRRLGQREIDLIEQLAHCQLEMTPRQFEAKWDVDRSQIAALCHCSLGNVKRWFKTDENYRSPTKYHRRYLALSNLYLEHFDRLPPELQQLICEGRSV
jgi:hypothetical protein